MNFTSFLSRFSTSKSRWGQVARWTLIMLMVPLSAYGQGLSSGSGSPSVAQGDVEWRVEEQPSTVRPGERLMVHFRGRVTDGWHTYALNSSAGRPLDITFDALPTGVTVERPLRQSQPTAQYDPNFKSQARYLNGQFEVRAALAVGADASIGSDTLRASVRYMVCNDRLCMLPQTTSIPVSITIEEGTSRDAFAQARFGELVAPVSDSASGAGSTAPTAAAGTDRCRPPLRRHAVSGGRTLPGSGALGSVAGQP